MVDEVRRSFGGLTAVDVDHLEIQRHAITALVGPNGAGKTTFFNLLTGFDQADSGPLDPRRHRAVGQVGLPGGPGRAWSAASSSPGRWPDSPWPRTWPSRPRTRPASASSAPSSAGAPWKRQEREQQDKIDDLLHRFKLDHVRDDFAGTLSGGQRKLLDMARALMSDPQLVCLDEPMAGVNPALTQSLLGHIQQLREDGLTVIFVEHDMDVVMEISDWVVVLAEGQVIAEGTPDAIGRNRGSSRPTSDTSRERA